MLLRELARYAERLQESGELPPQMYQPSRIRWLIDLDADGNLLGFVSTVADGAKGAEKRGKLFLTPHIDRTSAVKAKLLADRADYVLGLRDGDEPVEKAAQERLAACHAAFVERVVDCARSTDEASVVAVEQFLEDLNLATLVLPTDIAAADSVTFRVGGVLPIESAAVRSYWAEETQPEGEPGAERVCIICGESRIPAERHPLPIKGIPGGQTSGMQIISANADAFESYGLSASLVVPVCYPCAERYAQAANALLRGAETRLIVGPVAYIFWTRAQRRLNIVSLLSQPTAGDVKALLSSVYRGTEGQTADAEAFFAAALAASGGRVAVREWSATTVAEAQASLGRYFRLQSFVDAWGEEAAPLGVFALCSSLVRDSRDISPLAIAAIVGCALHGRPLPHSLLYQAVQRARLGNGGPQGNQHLTRPLVTLIKMVLCSALGDKEGERMRDLDLERDDPAYLCGRLLATLERIQTSAVHAKATIVDRFYGSASSAPLSVFPRLIRGSQSHLAKLRKERPGSHYALQSQLEETLSHLQGFPAVLTLAEQGSFALGYYHQRADDRRRASERSGETHADSVEPVAATSEA